MKILVTGAAGYIGSVLCPMLLNEGHYVTAVDDFRSGQHLALAACCSYTRFELVVGDARYETLGLINKADVIIPLAALVGAPLCAKRPYEAKVINSHAIRILCDLTSPNQLIIYPNTNSAYGKMPRGTNIEPLDETSPMNPLSVYAETKLDAEEAVLDQPHSVVFRLATVFGVSPRMRTDLMVNDFVLRAVHDKGMILYEPDARRNFVHVRDVGRAFTWAVAKYNGGSLLRTDKLFNLGHDDSNCTKLELCQRIHNHIPEFEVTINAGQDPDQRDYVISNERLRQAGFEATYDLDHGIKELIKLYQAFPRHPWGNV
jgi:nucleoside-diphosphate-sugar epimerase